MSGPIYERGENGQWLCPLLDGSLEWNEAGTEERRIAQTCFAPLHLVVEGTQPIFSETRLFVIDGADFNTSQWRVECENHHVLLRSAGEENAEPFLVDFLVDQVDTVHFLYGPLSRRVSGDDEVSGRISDNPEGFFAHFLRERAQDIEDGDYTAEGLRQSWPDDDTYEFTVTLGRPGAEESGS